jgi:hypothetical protein
MGAAIIDAIKSGLGLIGDLASEFLDGFSTLFWVEPTGTETVGHLTTFGMFALVMLGVAVSFAVVKLVLNIVRGNTGA